MIIKQQGLPYCARQETGGEGNCFFLAIVDQLGNKYIRKAISIRGRSIAHNHEAIRHQLVWFMRLNQEFYGDDDVGVWLNVEKANEDEAIDRGSKKGPKRSEEKIWIDYIQRMSQVGEWANEILIKAAAWFFKMDILVIKENTNYPIYGSPIRGEEHIREPHMAVVFLNDCHFQSVHKVKNGGGNIKQALWSESRSESMSSKKPEYTDSRLCRGCRLWVRHINDHLAQKPECRRHYSKEESVFAEILPCRGCGSIVKHINKHLVQKPECRRNYSEEELNAASLDMRRASRQNYNNAHQAEIRHKKADTYKATQEKNAQRSNAHNKAALNENEQKILSQSSSHLEASRSKKQPKDGSDGHCYICNTVFESIPDAKRHAKEVHGPKKFSCPSCNGTFTRRESLNCHVATVHNKSAKTLCTLCDVQFANTDSFVRHVHNVHEEERNFKCPHCPLTFARKDTLDKHVIRARVDFRKHGVEEECTRCHQKVIFPTRAAFQKHFKGKGKGKWWHNCREQDICADAWGSLEPWAEDNVDWNNVNKSWATNNNIDDEPDEGAWVTDQNT